MFRTGLAAALAALLLAAAACGQAPGSKADATAAVQDFLAAVHGGEADGFEARVDRPALRADLRRQIIQLARDKGLEVEGGPSDFALDRMIGPAAFRLVEVGSGAPLAGPPSEAQVAALLKKVDAQHVCLHDLSPAGACLLTFAREKAAKGAGRPNGWRLVRMPAQDLTIQVGPEPGSPAAPRS